ncbi:hypothetical protein COX05_03455 [candidate division WWE3 bacterium CG22_combo_CG10-13_8_21_14_all_39_12]|uniref:Glycosyltransferase RgtA/B/C/D-like domain-containing protein n=1 Tax=candidate division WWE3 bacterium CG22_combo_CG10-13_8_21_14_all_39_12 TaxID=1975094 RepID=A0A2H0BFL0_UNCKA|nr:MAG: hypothetical protein COX05_03455 [candidate division WWE3 bacterium CG22_combo_CG10-13_8_21_14_all_39_12]
MNFKIEKKYQLIIILSLTAMVVLFVWRSDSPYPLSLDWDLYAHWHVFNAMRHGYISIFPSHISDTFLLNTYLPVFAVITGVFRYVFGFLSQTGFYFVADSIHFTLNVMVGAFLGYATTKRYSVALVSGLLAAFIYESVVAQTSMFFIPQNLAALLIVSGVAFWLIEHKKVASTLLLSSFLIHYVIGVLGVLILLLLLASDYIKHKIKFSIPRVLPLVGIVTVIGAIIFAYFGEFNPFSSTESAQLTFGLLVKMDYLVTWYSFLIVGYVVGIWYVLKSQSTNKNLILGLSLGLLAAVILPIPYSLKLFTVGRYFINVILGIGIVSLVDSFTHRVVRILGFSILWLILLNLFIHNAATFKSAFPYHGVVSTVSTYELKAIDYIKEAYSKRDYGSVLLVSDPATQHVFEALTGINSQGGAFSTNETRNLISQTYRAPEVDSLLQLFTIKDGIIIKDVDTILLIVSGRYIQWQSLPDEKITDQTFNVWAPRDLTARAFEYIDKLEKTGVATKVFSNHGVAVFEINKP